MLHDIKNKIHSHPGLELHDGAEVNIWAYCSIMHISSTVMEGILIVILSIALIGKSLQMDLCRVYNLHALHPELKVQFTFEWKGQNLAISFSGTYAAITTVCEIHICFATQGHVCILNTALYLVKKIEWFVYTLFIKVCELIDKHCLVNSCTRHANLANYMDGYIWSVTHLATECIQIHCLEETHTETIIPPLMSIYVVNGCEGYNNNIYIPAKTDLTSEIDNSVRYEFFGSNALYQNMARYGK